MVKRWESLESRSMKMGFRELTVITLIFCPCLTFSLILFTMRLNTPRTFFGLQWYPWSWLKLGLKEYLIFGG